MTKLNSVFRDEIKMHLSVREAELSHEAYRHYRRTMVLFDNYLCRIHHTDKEILAVPDADTDKNREGNEHKDHQQRRPCPF